CHFMSFLSALLYFADLCTFLSLLCLPPCSTLFPYTTLFRSPPIRFDVRERLDLLRGTRTHEQTVRGRGGRGPHLGRRHHRPGPEDRKSTRLNSSHVSISYAVFCLKKKNRKH